MATEYPSAPWCWLVLASANPPTPNVVSGVPSTFSRATATLRLPAASVVEPTTSTLPRFGPFW